VIDIAIVTGVDTLEQPIQLPLEAVHPMPVVVAAPLAANTVVVIVMMMAMARAGAAQECHRTIEELFFRDRAVLVGVERIEQDLGAARGPRRWNGRRFWRYDWCLCRSG
jgi:hypothetical protein